MVWMVPQAILGEHQLDILRKCKDKDGGAEWIQGFAGSGKTVLAVHLAQQLKAEKPGMSICVAVFTHALKDLIDSGFEQRFSGQIPVMTYHQFLRERKHYDLVIVDEVQDVEIARLAQIRALAGRLVVAGDSDQSIYTQGGSADDIQKTIQPRVHKLAVVYRLTAKLIQIAKSILPKSGIEGGVTSGRMQDVQVTLAGAATEAEEIQWVWHNAKRWASAGDPVAILLPTHDVVKRFIETICDLEGKAQPEFKRFVHENGRPGKGPDYNHVNETLRRYGLSLQYTGNDFGSLRDSDSRALTYLMTYHSAKGLDFNTVFLPHLNEHMHFWRDNEDLDRRLFFVGVTRSRRNLYLSHTTEIPHPYVQAMPQKLLHKQTCTLAVTTKDDSSGFSF